MSCQDKKYRSNKGEVGKIAPNLLKRDFSTAAPNQKWVTDVTEFLLFSEKLYLSPILELHSSDLVSYVISERPVLSMVMNMLDSAARRLPRGQLPSCIPIRVGSTSTSNTRRNWLITASFKV